MLVIGIVAFVKNKTNKSKEKEKADPSPQKRTMTSTSVLDQFLPHLSALVPSHMHARAV